MSVAMSAARAQEIAATFDLRALPSDFYADPYPVYDVLREQSPVRLMPDDSYFLTRHQDLVAVYRDAQTFSSDKKIEFEPKYGATSPLFEHHTTSLVFNDPPLHTRVRSLIMGALTRRAIAGMESNLVTLVDSLLDELQTKGAGDLIEDFASAIPVEVIGNLLGVPHADRRPLRGWSLAILGALEPKLTPEQEALGNRSVTEFKFYLKTLVADRRKHPGNPEQDVLTRLIGNETTDEKLSEVELLQNCVFILNAGHETTTNLIGNALVALAEQPQVKTELLLKQELLATDIIGLEAYLNPVIDEFLRFESSNQLSNRRALKDTQIGGVHIAAGTLLSLCIGAANRDPAQFEQPNQLLLERQNNRHLAFGLGIHQCAGMSLARLEGRIAMGRFLQRFPSYRLLAAPTRGGRARFRGFLHAPFSVILASRKLRKILETGMQSTTTPPTEPKAFKRFSEFYPFYLTEHSNLTCRRLHFAGSSLSLVCLAMLVATGKPQYLLYGLLCGYGFAWLGHFGFEKNKPASFKRPLYSFMGDWAMYRDIWLGKVKI